MFLFIFESIGTQELLMVAVIAMIIFGPRKLPELMRKGGKMMADFRRTTNEFKQSWEKEVSMDEFKFDDDSEKSMPENTLEKKIGGTYPTFDDDVITPEIKEIRQEDFERAAGIRPDSVPTAETIAESTAETVQTEVPQPDDGKLSSDLTSKKNWL